MPNQFLQSAENFIAKACWDKTLWVQKDTTGVTGSRVLTSAGGYAILKETEEKKKEKEEKERKKQERIEKKKQKEELDM